MGRRYYRRGNSLFSTLVKLGVGIFLIYIWPVTLTFIIIKLVFSSCSRTKKSHRSYNNYNRNYSRSQNYKTPRQKYAKHSSQPSPAQSNRCNVSNPSFLSSNASYSSKESLMTDCEKNFFYVFRNVLPDEYIIQPQINLASIINKESFSQYQTELFRNIDFGIFDQNYTLKLLIEINDSTHMQPERIERDKKVCTICAQAGIPLITFWTEYGINETYIQNRLFKYLHLPITPINEGAADFQPSVFSESSDTKESL